LAAGPVLEAGAAMAAVRVLGIPIEITIGARGRALRHQRRFAIGARCGSSITAKRMSGSEGGDTGKHSGARLLEELAPVQRASQAFGKYPYLLVKDAHG